MSKEGDARSGTFDQIQPASSGRPGDDADARAFATHPANNVVLEASAGTGKTSVLVGRYVNLLRAGIDPANVLAITFTRKAAAEMRDRIVQELRAAAERSEIDATRWRTLRDRLTDIGISTIDAFCLSLLREFPLEADLDPGFALADETEVARLAEEALDRTLRLSGSLAGGDPDVAMVFAHLGARRVRAGLAHLLQHRIVARAALDRYLARAPSGLTGEVACRAAVGRLTDVLRAAPGGLERLVADGPVGHPRYGLLARDLLALPDLAHADPPEVRAALDRIRDYFLTRGNQARQTVAAGYAAGHCVSAIAWRRHRAALVSVAPAVAEALAAFDRDLNVILARGVRRTFAIAAGEYRRTLEAHAVLDFPEVLIRAHALLQQMDEFARSRFRLESRYHHVLVDEFQDTSRAQWDLVALLIRSWGEGLGLVHEMPLPPSIFVVGDRKQSIYGFRDAEVGLLEGAGRFIDQLRPGGRTRRAITRSFRATPALLAFVNDLFSEIEKVPGRSDAFRYGDDDRFPVVESVQGMTDDVLGVAVAADPAACAAAVAAEIVRLLGETIVRDRRSGLPRRAAAGDIAILFRSRESHREFDRALQARGVPAYVYKGLGFFDADEVKDVVALMRYLADPWSDLRAAAWLRSRLVRLSDRALARLAPGVAAALAGPPPSALAAFSDEDRRVLEQARESVRRWLALVDRLPPAELLDLILVETSYAFEIRGPRRLQAYENLKKIRSLVRRIQNRGYATMGRIAEHIDRLSTGDESNAAVDAVDAVHLMTVHASKGLEFPIVFVVNLTRGAAGRVMPIRVAAGAGDGCASVSVGRFISEADEDERLREREETKRLLYVALTRARDRLYLASVLKEGRLKPTAGSLAEVLPDSFRAMFAEAGTAEPGTTVCWRSKQGAAHPWRVCAPAAPVAAERDIHPVVAGAPPAPDEFAPLSPLPAGRRLSISGLLRDADRAGTAEGTGELDDRLVGVLVHRLFQLGAAAADPPGLARRALHLLRPAERATVPDLEALTTHAAELFSRLRNRPDVREALARGACLFEVPLSMRADPADPWSPVLRGSVDCLICRGDGGFTVLELKTGKPAPGHRVQLEAYISAVRARFPAAVVDGLLAYP